MTYTTVSETVAAYDEMLNEVASFAPIMRNMYFDGYDSAAALAEGDPIAYKCGWIDWCDAEGIDTDELEDDYTFTRDTW